MPGVEPRTGSSATGERAEARRRAWVPTVLSLGDRGPPAAAVTTARLALSSAASPGWSLSLVISEGLLIRTTDGASLNEVNRPSSAQGALSLLVCPARPCRKGNLRSHSGGPGSVTQGPGQGLRSRPLRTVGSDEEGPHRKLREQVSRSTLVAPGGTSGRCLPHPRVSWVSQRHPSPIMIKNFPASESLPAPLKTHVSDDISPTSIPARLHP